MDRTQIIQALIDRFDLRTYLEIGVFNGENFNKIRCESKTSVDPNYNATYMMTSDQYFAGLPGYVYPFDMIFIDGMHTDEQVYKDLCNSLECLADKGFIVVHDCNPQTQWHIRPESEYKRGEEWNGTTYRGFIRFKNEHPGLTCFTIDSDYGCGVVTERPLLENKCFEDDWEWFDRNRIGLLQLTSVDKFKTLL